MYQTKKSKSKSRVTFKLTSPTHVDILQDGKVIGQIWSYDPKQDCYPYEEDNNGGQYTEKNGIQICGFNNVSHIWDCHIFPNTKDMVVDFNSPKLPENKV